MRKLILSILAAASLTQALVGDWTSYTSIHSIRALKGSHGNLFAATSGGIRKRVPNGIEKVYRNTEGLLDVGINALALSPDGEVYASSEQGYIYHYDERADEWVILTSSYRSAAWRMNKRAMLWKSGYLVLGSEKGLTFFDLKKNVSAVNVSKMAKVNDFGVNSVLFVGDTLFVGTNHGIFKAELHLEKLMTDAKINIFNPGIWTQVEGTEKALFFDPESRSDDTAYVQDSLQLVNDITSDKSRGTPETFSHGFLYYGAKGIGSEYDGSASSDGKAMATFFGRIVVDGIPQGEKNRIETVENINGIWYGGAGHGIFTFVPKSADLGPIVNNEDIPWEGITAIRTNRYGVYAFATPYIYKLQGRVWAHLSDSLFTSSAGDLKKNGQHAFHVIGKSDAYLGTWGFGFQTWHDGVKKVLDATNSCMVSAIEALPNYPVIWSQAQYKEQGVWIGLLDVGKPYRIAYYDLATEAISCFEPKALLEEPRDLQVVDDSILVVVGEKGLEAFKISDHGGSVVLESKNLLDALTDAHESTLVGKIDLLGNFWVTTEGSALMYIPAISFKPGTTQAYKTLEGFPGLGCKSLEIDGQGHLWAGCTQGIYEITPKADSLTSNFRKYGQIDGLLSETIYALDVNKESGEVWAVTEKGLSRFESASRPVPANLNSLRVYPNPFLKKHAAVVFSNLTPGSEVQVLTQSGSVVYRHALPAGAGDQIRWDGNNRNGQRVGEGIYFYVVQSNRETKRGKLIVAR